MLRVLQIIIMVFGLMFQAVTSSANTHTQADPHKEMSAQVEAHTHSHSHCGEQKSIQDSTEKNESAGKSDGCCHMQCCSIYISSTIEFKTLFRDNRLNLSTVKNIRLNNYHNSIYRPPIA